MKIISKFFKKQKDYKAASCIVVDGSNMDKVIAEIHGDSDYINQIKDFVEATFKSQKITISTFNADDKLLHEKTFNKEVRNMALVEKI